MSENEKSRLGCILGCLGLSAGGLVVLFGGAAAAGLAFFALGPQGSSDYDTPSLAPVLAEVPAEVDDALADLEEEPAAPEDEDIDAEGADEADTEDAPEEEVEVVEVEPAPTRVSTTRSASSSRSSSSSTRTSTTRATNTSGTASTPTPSATPETSSTASGTADSDYEFPAPEPERPSTKVGYPPVNERQSGDRAKSWNVRTEGAVTDVRLAVETGTGTYKVPSLVPEDKYVIEANFGDGLYVDAGKINVKEGEQYFIQCKPTRKKCSVR